MQGLGNELRRLGFKPNAGNTMMAKAERESYDKPAPEVIARVTVITHGGYEDERQIHDALAIIATAYRNGTLTQAQAQALVQRLPTLTKK